MADRSIKFRELRAILGRYGVICDESAGKGSHVVFRKRFAEGEFTYPVPTSRADVLICYVKGCRKKFRLTPGDGVADDEFYGR